jgi:hypothetical protein
VERAKRHDATDFDDALIEAREDVAALHLLENLQVQFDAEATKQANAWLAEFKGAIKQLPDDRQDAYRQIIAMSTQPQDVDLALPVSRLEPTTVREQDGTEAMIPVYSRHLLCDDKGQYPAELNGWERKVLEAESAREGFRFWYRNPARPSQDSLGIGYVEDGETKIVRPDFIFFAEQDGKVVADIVDPHDPSRADALPKLQGLVRYVEAHPDAFRRVAAVAFVDGRWRVLELTRMDVRNAVITATSTTGLYAGAIAGDYH